jgi:hypothetical protein
MCDAAICIPPGLPSPSKALPLALDVARTHMYLPAYIASNMGMCRWPACLFHMASLGRCHVCARHMHCGSDFRDSAERGYYLSMGQRSPGTCSLDRGAVALHPERPLTNEPVLAVWSRLLAVRLATPDTLRSLSVELKRHGR